MQNSLLVDWIFQLRTQSDNTLSKLAFLALALQKRVGAEVDYFDYKATKFDHCFNLVFEYETEMTGKQAVKSAVAIINQLAKKQNVIFLNSLIY